MKTAICLLTLFGSLLLAACDAPVCDDGLCDTGPVESTPGDDDVPEPPAAEAPEAEPRPYPACDADELEGFACDCGGLEIDLRAFEGELVASGEDSLVLHRAGIGTDIGWSACGDVYVWEDEGPSCALSVTRPDQGCFGLAIRQIPNSDETCPYAETVSACRPLTTPQDD